jgi:hypothetical protein
MSYPHTAEVLAKQQAARQQTREVVAAALDAHQAAAAEAEGLLGQYQRLCETFEGQIETLKLQLRDATEARAKAETELAAAQTAREVAERLAASYAEHPEVKAAAEKRRQAQAAALRAQLAALEQ